MTRAVFLDRDGTLIEEVGYLDRLDRLQLFPYSIDAVRLLNRAGFDVVVATNQSGVARGFFDESFVHESHRFIADALMKGGARLDALYYCPHHPDAEIAAYRQACDCRKPQAGLLRRAAADRDIDLQRSFVVGDRAGDVEAARAAGAKGVLVRTGNGARVDPKSHHPAPSVENLMEAVSWILRQP